MLISLILLLNMLAEAQSGTYTIPAKGGCFVISEVKLSQQSEDRKRWSEITGWIENATGRRWDNLRIQARLTGNTQSEAVRIDIVSMPPESSQWFSVSVQGGPLEASSISFRLLGGVSFDTPEEMARKAVAAAARATRRRAERQAYLAQLPTLHSGTDLTFVGADRKCAVQFSEALRMKGLEKRKRIAELITFQCGFTAKSGTRVQRVRRESGYSLVKVQEGDHIDKIGWVPDGWVR